MPFIPLRDGQQLYVRTLGRGKPVLMLAGLGMHSGHWLPFVLPFAHRYKFYMPDFRGAGRSSDVRFNQADVFQNHYEDVVDIIKYLGLSHYLLVGISLGGTTALHLQREQGFADVKAYLHIDQTPCIANQDDWPFGLFGDKQRLIFAQIKQLAQLLDQYADYAQLSDLPKAARQQAASTLADILVLISNKPVLKPLFRWLLVSPKQLAKHLPLTQIADCRAYLHAYTQLSHDYRDSLRQCQTPITVMVGMNSPLYHPEGQMRIADYAPQVKIRKFYRSGHVPLADEPLKFVREFKRFLSQHT
ncbi:pimeloyl-ACP methyl ester carboxylesterase [Agitococcus lubricus]|uniref:Pimeloyl-ACP methyl ester carboxylesterase n=2 Tax=Agitococcus lubricus TaxID=1077255 RepID=A0A2T5J2V5_9GAMM|nr:pimeloyl-ACP methyl ester carboxylesterase [Agitococcus lubricus]